MYEVGKIADYFIKLACDCGDHMSNMKLQKLLYYAQGWHLALFDSRLFEGKFKAWVYGPVLVEQYQRFKQYGSGNIAEHYDPGPVSIDEETAEFLEEIMTTHGKYSPFYLAMATHNEPPWQNARKGLAQDEPSDNEISEDDMRTYFKSLMDDSEAVSVAHG